MRGGVISNCTIASNYSFQYGGGIGCQAAAPCLIQDSQIINNVGSNNAGGVMLVEGVVLSNCVVAGTSCTRSESVV